MNCAMRIPVSDGWLACRDDGFRLPCYIICVCSLMKIAEVGLIPLVLVGRPAARQFLSCYVCVACVCVVGLDMLCTFDQTRTRSHRTQWGPRYLQKLRPNVIYY